MAGFGSLIAGFVKGASDYGVDQIKRRQDAEQEIEKAKLLERLRLDTQKELETFREQLTANDVDKDLSSPDFARGKLVFRNKKGDITRERDLTADEIQAHKLDTEKATLGLDNTRSEIASRAHDDANADARLALDRASTSQSIAESKHRMAKDGDLDGTKVLSKEYNNAKDELTKAGVNPSVLAEFQNTWYEGVNKSKWSPSQQRVYLMEMRRRIVRGDKTLPALKDTLAADAAMRAKLAE